MTGYDLINLLFLAIAAIVFFRLRSVLGKRTGNERPPTNPYARGPFERTKTGDAAENDNPDDTSQGAADDNVIRLPGADQASDLPAELARPAYAPAGTPLAAGLAQIELADRSFTPQEFLDGAATAHEMIVTAFAAGDRQVLGRLLDDEVYRDFETAIEDRDAEGRTLEQTYVGLTGKDIISAEYDDGRARLTVKFTSEMISTLRAANGDVVEGSPEAVRQVVDVWTFERDTKSRDPNWRLVATGGN